MNSYHRRFLDLTVRTIETVTRRIRSFLLIFGGSRNINRPLGPFLPCGWVKRLIVAIAIGGLTLLSVIACQKNPQLVSSAPLSGVVAPGYRFMEELGTKPRVCDLPGPETGCVDLFERHTSPHSRRSVRGPWGLGKARVAPGEEFVKKSTNMLTSCPERRI